MRLVLACGVLLVGACAPFAHQATAPTARPWSPLAVSWEPERGWPARDYDIVGLRLGAIGARHQSAAGREGAVWPSCNRCSRSCLVRLLSGLSAHFAMMRSFNSSGMPVAGGCSVLACLSANKASTASRMIRRGGSSFAPGISAAPL